MKIIPAIDIINGNCVRLTKGNYSTKKIYNTNPVDVAKQFEASGITNLHLVDLDGAKANGIVNYNVLEQIASQTQLKIDFGGGIKSEKDLKIALNSGASQVTVGSLAVTQPQLVIQWLNTYGSDKLILGADCNDDLIAISGWQQPTTTNVLSFINTYYLQGVTTVICTDIAKDGMLQGPAFTLYKNIINHTPTPQGKPPIQLIASGGVTTLANVKQLQQMGCYGAIIGKAIYENTITLKQLETFIVSNS